MYNSEITSKVYELKDKLLQSREYQLVKEKEKLMEDNCSELLMKYNYLFNEYNEALRFKNYDSSLEEKRKKLHECKLEVDNNEYVIAYKKAYKAMSELLKNIQDLIFKDIIVNKDSLKS